MAKKGVTLTMCCCSWILCNCFTIIYTEQLSSSILHLRFGQSSIFTLIDSFVHLPLLFSEHTLYPRSEKFPLDTCNWSSILYLNGKVKNCKSNIVKRNNSRFNMKIDDEIAYLIVGFDCEIKNSLHCVAPVLSLR